MSTTLKDVYKYNIEKALDESIKEMRLIKMGNLPKRSWAELKAELEKEK